MQFEIRSTAYGWLMLAGIIVSVCFWSRMTQRNDRLVVIYVAALVGAFIGAKIIYLFSEGWLDWRRPDRWLRLATGKSILGGLLGGYLSVEIAKRCVGYERATGDWFAVIVPIGILFGRVGCLLHGCCLGTICESKWYSIADANGVTRWPAVPVEIIFNLAAVLSALIFQKASMLEGQRFHIYLMAYGAFRFGHEFLRDTPQIFGGISGYQISALAVGLLGLTGFLGRRTKSPVDLPSNSQRELKEKFEPNRFV